VADHDLSHASSVGRDAPLIGDAGTFLRARNDLKGHAKMNASNYSSEAIAHDEVAFPVLNPAEIRVAEKFGRRERLEAGRVLFEPGQQLVELLVILDGSLELIDNSGDQERILAVHGTRGFVGEISLLTGRRATSFCRVKSAAEVIRIPVGAVRRLLVSSASFAEKWMTSLLRRREVILARGTV
jgi:CRP-like cAMP-binding protein